MQEWETLESSDFIHSLTIRPDSNGYPVDNRYAWILGLLPSVYIIIYILLNGNLAIPFFTACACNAMLWILDRMKLKKSNYKIGAWNWLGIILTPVYLFARAKKNTKMRVCICLDFFGHRILFFIGEYILLLCSSNKRLKKHPHCLV